MIMNRHSTLLASQIESATLGSLIHLVEITGREIDADIAAGRVISTQDDTEKMTHHVRTWARLPEQEHARMNDEWPIQPNSLFHKLNPSMCEQEVFRFSEIMPTELWQDCSPMSMLTHEPVRDVIGMCLPVTDESWASFIYLRLGQSKTFDLGSIALLNSLRETLDKQLSTAVSRDVGEIMLYNNHLDEQTLEEVLSQTEQQVLQHMAAGLTERAIGKAMNRSRHTVHVHVKNIYRKLQVNSRSQLLDKLGGLTQNLRAMYDQQQRHTVMA